MANTQKLRPADKRWFSTAEAAEYLGCSKLTLSHWARDYPELLPRYRPASPNARSIRFRKEDLDSFMVLDQSRAEARDSEISAA